MIAIVFHYFQPNIRYTIHQPNIKTQPIEKQLIQEEQQLRKHYFG